MNSNKKKYLKQTVEHISLNSFNPVPLVDAMEKMAFQARNLARAAKIYEQMVRDTNCAVILCLAGSLISAGLKKVIVELIQNNMVDAIVSTGANLVDQDFFEGLGFRHYIGTPMVDDNELRELRVDRIYDTFIDEDELCVCDSTIAEIANGLPPRPYSSREFMRELGRYLAKKAKTRDSIVLTCYEKEVPIFVPALSDCSAGFGLVHHQYERELAGKPMVSIDSAKDFLELTKIKVETGMTGLLMIGGGIPKNFAQDVVVAAEELGKEVQMHKYAVQITVADERDGALSGSTLKEANSWGKVDRGQEQMVFGEATVLFPLLAGYAYHKKAYQGRPAMKLNQICEKQKTTAKRSS